MMGRKALTSEYLVILIIGAVILILSLVPFLLPLIGMDTSGYERQKALHDLKEFRDEISSLCSSSQEHESEMSYAFNDNIRGVIIDEGQYHADAETHKGVTADFGTCESVTICDSAGGPEQPVDDDCSGEGRLNGGEVTFKIKVVAQTVHIQPYEDSLASE
jgi:hypothetical protein